jgi:hypothetical protein
MRILWTLLKTILALAIAIPLGIMALVLSLGVLGGLLALAVLTLKLACVGLVAYGMFRVARFMFGGKSAAKRPVARELPAPDPYYEAAMRELNSEMGVSNGR